MPVFQIQNGKAQHLDSAEFQKELELQQLFENNLEELLGIRLVHREYAINSESGRIDTLGIDESNRPVIIEYKLGTAPDDVLTQGKAYQKWVNTNRKLFNLLVKDIYKLEVDWQLTRLIFIAKDFSPRMRDAVKGEDDVDLVRYTLIQNGLLVIDSLSGQLKNRRKKTSVPTLTQEDKDEVERYLLQTNLLLHKPFYELRKRIHQLSGVREVIQPKVGITYYKTQAIARFEFRKNHIDLLLKKGASDANPDERLRDITTNKWGFPYLFKISKLEDVEYAFNLIQAAYLAAT